MRIGRNQFIQSSKDDNKLMAFSKNVLLIHKNQKIVLPVTKIIFKKICWNCFLYSKKPWIKKTKFQVKNFYRFQPFLYSVYFLSADFTIMKCHGDMLAHPLGAERWLVRSPFGVGAFVRLVGVLTILLQWVTKSIIESSEVAHENIKSEWFVYFQE